MSWTLGGVRVFTQKLSDSDIQIIARLQPLGGGTTLHTFGYEDRITKLSGYVVGLTDRDALEAMAKDDAWHALATPYGAWGNYKVKSVDFTLTNMICQTLRPDLPENSPVFDTSFELYYQVT